ncbi:Hypothetical protein MexAM1_META1p4652 [Methylorubrum extorquens AM1]|uniref:Uncharacterized protein n=1 Tax=Methylorubrum extorquens (strain ATCC 14718 / DSM 1338 / JCM 2805 / NCIMB 9133 / AM1) TaxID=272630 RepID=C5AR08_METEA|nr:Hypothetical protein MexAM1_META1p4652 [Methylorubrum extorquens AM1]
MLTLRVRPRKVLATAHASSKPSQRTDASNGSIELLGRLPWHRHRFAPWHGSGRFSFQLPAPSDGTAGWFPR